MIFPIINQRIHHLNRTKTNSEYYYYNKLYLEWESNQNISNGAINFQNRNKECKVLVEIKTSVIQGISKEILQIPHNK